MVSPWKWTAVSYLDRNCSGNGGVIALAGAELAHQNDRGGDRETLVNYSQFAPLGFTNGKARLPANIGAACVQEPGKPLLTRTG